MKKKKLICTVCGSTDILVDAYAQWNETTQKFELFETFDKGHFCNNCEGECSVKWKEIK